MTMYLATRIGCSWNGNSIIPRCSDAPNTAPNKLLSFYFNTLQVEYNKFLQNATNTYNCMNIFACTGWAI